MPRWSGLSSVNRRLSPDPVDRADEFGALITMSTATVPKQLLHLVFGGELERLDDVTFRDLNKLEIVGIFPNYASAYAAWKAKAQQSVDNAHMRYFIAHLHRLLEPENPATPSVRTDGRR
jgi:hypothetical protein